uniref:Uncharacterized protein n=1 Tax=Streptomyces phage Scarif TaxID=3158858 RepID=A0AAU7H0H2_9CAUD
MSLKTYAASEAVFGKDARRADAQKNYNRHMRNDKIAKAAVLAANVVLGVTALALSRKERQKSNDN